MKILLQNLTLLALLLFGGIASPSDGVLSGVDLPTNEILYRSCMGILIALLIYFIWDLLYPEKYYK